MFIVPVSAQSWMREEMNPIYSQTIKFKAVVSTIKSINKKIGVGFQFKKKKHPWNSLMAQWVKGPELSLKRLGSLPWHGFHPWPTNFHILWA